MMDRLYPQMWMSLTIEVKKVLIEAFRMEKTGRVEIMNSEVLSDGFLLGDLQKAINVETMKVWLGKTELNSFPAAWELTLKKVDETLNPKATVAPINVKPTDVLKESSLVEEATDKNETNGKK